MRRIALKVCLVGFVLIGLAIASSFGLIRLASAPPDYYAKIIAAESETDIQARHDRAEELVGDVVQMRNDIANDPEWTLRFTDTSVNAWLAENSLVDLIEDFPVELTQPRFKFEAERLMLAFRWDGPPIAAVVSLSLRPKCVSSNELRIGVEKVRAGMLPMSGQRFQQDVIAYLKTAGLNARWIVEDDLPTLCLTVQPSLQSKSVELERITVLDGEIRVSGKSNAEVNAKSIGDAAREISRLRRFR